MYDREIILSRAVSATLKFFFKEKNLSDTTENTQNEQNKNIAHLRSPFTK